MVSAFRRTFAAGLIAVLALAGCTRGSSDAVRRLVVLAVDGVEWDLVLKLIREGCMPEVERLMGEGTYGRLETLEPTQSPVIWTSIATGKTPEQHGILRWTIHDAAHPRNGQLYSNGDRKTKAFWNVASDYQRRVAVIGWFVTYPVEPVNGVMVAQTNTSSPKEWLAGEAIAKGGLVEGLPQQVYPPDREAEVMGDLARSNAELPELKRRVFGDFPHGPSPQAASLLEASDWAFRSDATYAALAKKLAGDQPPYDLLAVYLGGPDVVGHRFWRYMEPDRYAHPAGQEDVENFRDVIPDYYAYVDSFLGELRARVGANATIVMLSDHGMHAVNLDAPFAPEERGRKILSGHHQDAPPGFFVAAGPGIRKLALPSGGIAKLDKATLPRAGSVFDVAPTLLALLGIAVGEDMHGTVMTEMLDPEFLRRHPVRSVPTHDTPEWLAARPKVGQAEPNPAERMEQLRSLGYVE